MQFSNLLLVFLGGGLGSTLRFVISRSVQTLANGWIFPVGTSVVNISGCLIIGLLGGLAESRGIFGQEARLFVFIGILGGYTTFSTFGYESFQLFRDGEFVLAAANVLLQVVLGLTFVWLGFALSKFA